MQKVQKGQEMQIFKEQGKKKKKTVINAGQWVRDKRWNQRDGQELNEGILGHNKNITLSEMRSYWRLRNMYLPIWIAALEY